MSIRYDYYNTGDTGSNGFDDERWGANTFTVSEAFVIESVKLKLLRSATQAPGTITVSIRATSAGVPTGADLISGTTDGDSLTTDAGGEWREITFSAQRSLSAGTQYAIVVRCSAPEVGGDYPLKWRVDGAAPAYSDGNYCWSTDSGANWSLLGSDADHMFECWGSGDLVLAAAEKTTVKRLVVFASNKAYYET